MSIGREWIKAIQNTSKLLHTLARGLEVPALKIRNESSTTPIIVHQATTVPVIDYSPMIADIEWKKSQAYMIPARNSVR